MTVGQALLLGAVQGATEFLPISSSGHLAVIRSLMDIAAIPILFDVLLHVATLVVVVVVFRKRIGALLASLGRWIARRTTDGDGPNLRLAWAIVVATILTGAIGIGVKQLNPGESPRLISALFILTGLILVASRFFSGNRDYSAIGWREGLVVGIAQGLGVFPGISRSGITISAGLASGLKREQAGEFAFLVSIPAIVGAFLLTLREAGELSQTVSGGALAAGAAAALVVGLAALTVLLRLVRSGKLFYFAIYLIPAGILGLVFL